MYPRILAGLPVRKSRFQDWILHSRKRVRGILCVERRFADGVRICGKRSIAARGGILAVADHIDSVLCEHRRRPGFRHGSKEISGYLLRELRQRIVPFVREP